MAILSLLIPTGCSAGRGESHESSGSNPPVSPERTALGEKAQRRDPSTSHLSPRFVIAISVDGLNPDAIAELGPSGTPTLHWLIAHGASTLNARTDLERTWTLPNHSSMVTSRPVLGSAGHQVTFNHDDGSAVAEAAGHYEASVFDVVHDAGGSTAFYSSKHKLDFLDRSWDAGHGAPDVTGVDDGSDKIDHYVVDSGAANVDRLLGRLSVRPDELSFLHLADPDTTGHSSGFMSRQYLEAVRRTDALLGRIVQAVQRSRRLASSVEVMVTADHGGRGDDHSDASSQDNYRVPFIVWGPEVEPGADLYDLNQARRDPGAARTQYVGAQPIRNGDLGNLITSSLSLPAIPGSVFNAAQDLRISRRQPTH